MSYKNKTYVCFDADNDMWAYKYMLGWRANDRIDFNFHNAHELTKLMSWSSEETIKRSLRERFEGTKMFMILIGESTKNLYKFVRREIEEAIKRNLPIICVYLDKTSRHMNESTCPAILRNALAIHIPYRQAIMKHAMDYWYDSHFEHKRNGDAGPYVYNDNVYTRLGL